MQGSGMHSGNVSSPEGARVRIAACSSGSISALADADSTSTHDARLDRESRPARPRKSMTFDIPLSLMTSLWQWIVPVDYRDNRDIRPTLLQTASPVAPRRKACARRRG
jgi:hypothetical protein